MIGPNPATPNSYGNGARNSNEKNTVQNSKKKLIISAFEECNVSDALADLAGLTECLCDVEEGSHNRYGLFLFHKLIVDNLEMLSVRARPEKTAYPEDEMMLND
jgi:hypothetical protein